MEQKGQAAMEFLMTYGWAILAAIIAIGVLAYFGVFSPGNFVAAAATVNAPFGINAHNIVTNSSGEFINLDMIQNSGGTLSNTTVTTTGNGEFSGITCTSGAVTTWNSGQEVSVSLDCTGGTLASGDSFSGDIVVAYHKQGSSLDLQTTGTIRDTVQ